MNSKYSFIIIVCSGLMLSACHDNNSAGGDGVTTQPENELTVFGNLSADDEPLAITNKLEQDIQAVFGDADNKAVDVIVGDNVQSVIDRAGLN